MLFSPFLFEFDFQITVAYVHLIFAFEKWFLVNICRLLGLHLEEFILIDKGE